MPQRTKFDRSDEDSGNVIALEHANVCIPDQRLATLFYVTGLGLTRDPYLVTSVNNMWINIGRNQFHLPTHEPQVLRGKIGIVIPDRKALLARLRSVKTLLKGTKFRFTVADSFVSATCPWGNSFRIHTPSKQFGQMALGIAYIEFGVAPGNAAGISRFYRQILGAPAVVQKTKGVAAHVQVGHHQELIFRETTGRITPFDGHHIQIYVADFSGPYNGLREHNLISEESNQHQYRFKDIIDLETGKLLFSLDHEIRSLTHPLFARPLVNRNPNQTNRDFGAGHENQSWALPSTP
ncbi:MAG: hypothetical protein VYA17_07830 [Pseudomonadota bacterium]|nr:hypothetical protein [Pseudomonadota bacterium]